MAEWSNLVGSACSLQSRKADPQTGRFEAGAGRWTKLGGASVVTAGPAIRHEVLVGPGSARVPFTQQPAMRLHGLDEPRLRLGVFLLIVQVHRQVCLRQHRL